jgi:hypothetical protein
MDAEITVIGPASLARMALVPTGMFYAFKRTGKTRMQAAMNQLQL